MAQPDTRLAGDLAELKLLVSGLASNALRTQQAQATATQYSPPPAFSRAAPAANGGQPSFKWAALAAFQPLPAHTVCCLTASAATGAATGAAYANGSRQVPISNGNHADRQPPQGSSLSPQSHADATSAPERQSKANGNPSYMDVRLPAPCAGCCIPMHASADCTGMEQVLEMLEKGETPPGIRTDIQARSATLPSLPAGTGREGRFPAALGSAI